MYDLITYTTNKGQSGTLDPSSSPSVITRTIDFDTVWIDLSVDLEQSPNPEYIRGWFFELNELPGYSFYPNSSAIQTGLNPPEKRIFTSNQKIRLYIDLNTMLQLDGLRPHDFVLSTVVATSDSSITYSETTNVLTNASLANCTLNSSTGVISTTDFAGANTTAATYTFTLRATDAEGQTADRQFTLTSSFGATGGAQFN